MVSTMRPWQLGGAGTLLWLTRRWRPLVAHRYEYMFTPAQLGFLCSCLDETRGVPGDVVEIGCARGSTTVFLNKHLDELEASCRYVALDTFTGFLAGDIAYEVTRRGKSQHEEEYARAFTGTSIELYRYTMRLNGVSRVHAVKGGVSDVDLVSLAPRVAMALIDVDLYRPVRASIGKIYPLLQPGGIMIVDDCTTGGPWDGALQAYREFVTERDLPEVVVHQKLGVIKRPSALSGR